MKFTLLLTLFCFSALGEFHQICGKYFIEDLKFTQNEKIFICGSEASGWKDVPENQAKFHLTGFLNARGYFKFRFEEKNKNIYIEKGEISRIEKIYFHGGPSGFFDTQYIGMYGKTLTEDHLGEISGWTEARLASIGFPCAKVQTHASYATGDVLVYIEPSEKIFIQELKREKTPKLKAVALERYDAINEGDLYNRDFLALTSRRVMNSELSSYTYFDHSCKRPGFLEEKLILDEPNSLIFAIGASTEEFPIFKIRWLNSRVNRMGTNLSAQLYLSSRERSLNLQSKIYLLETMPALYFGPQLQYEETYEDIYQTKSTIYTGFVGMQWDLSDYQLEDRLSLSRVNELQDEGRGAKELNYTVLENRTSYTSHYYEYYLSNPQKGDDYELRLSQFNVSNSLKSGIAGQYLNFRGKNLFNIGAYSPPSYVFGIRYHFASLVSESLLATPQRFRLYLGGESDIRGFSRKSINNEELGYKTTAHLAMESRFNNWLPYKLQPLVLLDFAKLGEQEFSFNAPLLYSPGLGLRWSSPFGNFRATVAAGKMTKQIAGVQEQVNVIFTYGREF